MKQGVSTNTNEIQRIMRKYFDKLYSNNLENLEEMDKDLYSFYLVDFFHYYCYAGGTL
jgi:hypothetical protein